MLLLWRNSDNSKVFDPLIYTHFKVKKVDRPRKREVNLQCDAFYTKNIRLLRY